jgi:hypothetical protein
MCMISAHTPVLNICKQKKGQPPAGRDSSLHPVVRRDATERVRANFAI